MKNFIKINRALAAKKKSILFFAAVLLSICNAFAVVTWDGTTDPWTKGAGTQSNPYLIENPKQLAFLADMVYAGVSNYQGVYFKQTEDFDMNGKAWVPSGTETNYFSGVYDGNNKMIQNIILKGVSNVRYAGLFAYTKNATIQNVRLKIKEYHSSTYSGGICGYMNGGTIRNCEVSAHSDSITPSYVIFFGGIVGYMESATMDQCSNNVIYDVSSSAEYTYSYGGLVGSISGTKTAKAYITNSYNKKRIYCSIKNISGAHIGGTVGYVNGYVEMNNVHASGVYSSASTQTSTSSYVYIGGLIGFVHSSSNIKITLCSNNGDIRSTGSNGLPYIGGLISYSEGSCTITACSHRGNIVATNATSISGLCYKGSIYSSYCVGDLTTSSAGVWGIGRGTINNCYYAGKISTSGSKYAIGGSCTNCYYLEGCGGYGQSGATARTESAMKSASFPVMLNQGGAATFYMDQGNVNKGYPVLEYDKLNTYTITWKNADGTTLETDTDVPEGTTPTYNGSTPTKASTAQYTYTFSGWTPNVVTVTGDATYTAQFTTTLKKYAISFVNYDGTPLQSSEVEYGAIPAYNGETPSKPADAQYTYTFEGWSPEVVAVDGEATYTAQFTSSLNKYAISFVNYDGTPLQSGEVEYGAIPTFNGEVPSKPADAQYTYTFSGWTPEVVAVDGEAIYTAQFTTTLKKYVISFVNYDGTPLQSSEVEYGAIPAYNGGTPSKPADAQYTYTFAGWSPEVVAVDGEATYTAQFTSTPIITGPIVIGNGESQNLSDLDPAGTQFVEEIIVEIGGELNVDDANIHIDELVICVDGTNSGQVLHGIEGINADHIYLEYILNPCGELASPNRWYAISVPFEVDIATGISRTCDNKTLMSGTDFLIKEYDGMQRATTGNGWKKKLSGTLEPGHFYMIGIDGNCNRWRFEKKAGQPCEGDTHMAYNEYTSDNSEDAGWNGLGNTMLEYMRMNMGLSDIVYIVTYDNCYSRFVTQLLAEINLCVGRPFFIQASSDGNFDFVFGSGSNNMPALYAQRETKPLMHFTLTDETQSTGTDHMFLTMHEDATADYTIGRDVARMSKDCKTAAQLWCTMPDGKQLSAHGISIPETETVVPVTFFAPTKGEYLINMSSRAMDDYEVELLHNGAWVATFNAQPVSLHLNAGNNSGYSVRIVRRAQTDIENVQSDKVQSSKVLINEHIYIIRGEHMYSVQGELVK